MRRNSIPLPVVLVCHAGGLSTFPGAFVQERLSETVLARPTQSSTRPAHSSASRTPSRRAPPGRCSSLMARKIQFRSSLVLVAVARRLLIVATPLLGADHRPRTVPLPQGCWLGPLAQNLCRSPITFVVGQLGDLVASPHRRLQRPPPRICPCSVSKVAPQAVRAMRRPELRGIVPPGPRTHACER